jgi:hypothetical protein
VIVMPANNRGLVVGWLAGRFPDRIGHLYSPGGMARLHDFLPFALDNGRFSVWAAGKQWDEAAFIGMLDRVKATCKVPRWVLVPDVVADRDATLREWDHWCARLQAYRWPLAFAAQDGMKPDDVPAEAEVVFIGGSTDWKRRTLHDWCEAFERVHVGRINTDKWLWECHEAGAESCDGTGWMRGDERQLAGLIRFMEQTSKGAGNPRGGQLFAAAGGPDA